MFLIFATDLSPHVGQVPPYIWKVRITLQDEEEFPIIRKGREKYFSWALSSSGSEC